MVAHRATILTLAVACGVACVRLLRPSVSGVGEYLGSDDHGDWQGSYREARVGALRLQFIWWWR